MLETRKRRGVVGASEDIRRDGGEVVPLRFSGWKISKKRSSIVQTKAVHERFYETVTGDTYRSSHGCTRYKIAIKARYYT